ncbi:hypothetical protein GN156_36825, partial [bacterium LRH843]|nr:hypothetical protein [bacterium LRH843]
FALLFWVSGKALILLTSSITPTVVSGTGGVVEQAVRVKQVAVAKKRVLSFIIQVLTCVVIGYQYNHICSFSESSE